MEKKVLSRELRIRYNSLENTLYEVKVGDDESNYLVTMRQTQFDSSMFDNHDISTII